MKSIYTVGQVNMYIKNMFTQDFMLNKISVKGEVSNCKYHTSGHIYFSLKDETGTIACVMFAGMRKGLAFSMKNGDRVVVSGSVNVYERDGKYQLYARQIQLEGAGLLYERFLALKQELEDMGMFAAQYKQPIPRYIRRLGVVTAPTGAAVQDIRNIALRRNPFLQILLYPALVQGEGAKESIVKGIETLDQAGVDVIIVGRGGGSMEDLWAFNEEEVARAIFECSTPVISAVGHETDVKIADFVADLRAPTPSAAAEIAVDDYQSTQDQIRDYQKRLDQAMQGKITLLQSRLEQYRIRLSYLSPRQQIYERRQYLADLQERLERGMSSKITDARQELRVYAQKLDGMSPLKKMTQGFSYVTDECGQAVSRLEQVRPGDRIQIQVTDGEIQAQVTSCVPVDRENQHG